MKAGVNQFSHNSCQEAIHTLCSALILRCQCGLKTYALFIDLIKAYDALLLQVVTKYGIPPKVQRTIKKLYTNCTVQLEIGKEKCEIEYSTGVQQGNNLVPILFLLYVIQAAMETLHKKLTFNQLQYRHFSDLKGKGCQNGRLSLQPNPKTMKKTKKPFQLDNLLYAVEGIFLLKTMEELMEATQTFYDHFA